MQRSNIYKSAIDKSKIYLAILPLLAVEIVLLFIYFFGKESFNVKRPNDILLFVIFLVMLHISVVVFSFNLRYHLNKTSIQIKSLGFTIYVIKILDIKRIDRKKRAMQVLGLSDRKYISLKLKGGKNKGQPRFSEVNVSPLDEETFIKKVLNINPNIEIDI